MKGYLFAGQGAQFVGMAADIYADSQAARDLFDRGSKVLGWDVAEICFEGPMAELTKTSRCQAAILIASLAIREAMRDKGAEEPCCLAGLSLGEYSALTCAGAIAFEESVRIVQRRGELMQESAEKSNGSMASVIGLDLADVESACAEAGEGVYVANINSPRQVVISGELEALAKAEKLASEKGAKRVVRLDVAGAFHSPFMQSAADSLAEALEDVDISSPSIPVLSNVTGEAHPDSAEGIKELLVKQVTSRVQWVKCIAGMIGKGADGFFEIGPGKVLSGLMRGIDRGIKCASISSVKDVESLGGGE
jgi:[acyl-carrier-protein] S-malonyltransferase